MAPDPEASLVRILSSPESLEALGTAFFVTADGYLLTCYHVIEGLREIWLTWEGQTEPIRAESHAIWCNAEKDFALLKASLPQGKTVQPVSLAMDWDRSDEVFSAGYQYESLGFTSFPAFGKITGRTTRNKQPFLVIEEATNIERGISGAPALNQRTGQVIGVITEKYQEVNTALIIPSEEIARSLSTLPDLDWSLSKLFQSLLSRRPTPGKPSQAPPIPDYFVPRLKVSQDIKILLLEDQITSPNALVISAIHGLGGIGKSTLAAALASEVHMYFPDGILWVTLGQQPDVLPLLSGWVQEMGDYQFRAASLEATESHLRTLLRDKTALLVVDDAWSVEDVRPFLVGGPQCRVLITTREALIAKSVGAALYNLELMTPEQAFALLEGKLRRTLTGPERDQALNLCRAVGFLPLALELAAAQVMDGIPWTELLEDLDAEIARLEALEIPGAEETIGEASRKRLSLRASFVLSLRRLSDEKRQSFAWLGVTSEDATLTPAMAATLWETNARTARDILRYLRDKALLLSATPLPGGIQTYRLHDLLHDFARRLLTGPLDPIRTDELPGLGLTMQSAHAALLNRYRSRTQNGMWHTLLDDGYICNHLAWHMEQAGKEQDIFNLLSKETTEGRNGWYKARERLGQIAGYIDDIIRAWRLAEKQFMVEHSSSALGLQCRFSLIISSINSLSQNIPPKLLVALVKKEVWTLPQALAIAVHNPNPSDLGIALASIAPYLSEPLLRQALTAAQHIEDKKERVCALRDLVPHLPKSLLEQAIATTQATRTSLKSKHEDFWVDHTLSDQAAQLAKLGFSDIALSTIGQIEKDYIKADILVKLYPYLNVQQVREALEMTLRFESDSNVSQKPEAGVVADLLCRLSELGCEDDAIDIARGIQDSSVRFYVKAALASQLAKQGYFDKAICMTQEINYGDRAYAMAALAIQLAKQRYFDKAIRMTQEIDYDYEGNRAYAIAEMAPFLPRPVLLEAWTIALGIKPSKYRADAMIGVAPYLPPELQGKALQDTLRATLPSWGREEQITKLSPYLPEPLLQEALELLQQSEGGWRNSWKKEEALVKLARYLPEHLLRKTIDVTLSQVSDDILDDYGLQKSLAGLLPRLAELGHPGEALDLAKKYEHYEVLSALAPHLPEALLQEALGIIRKYEYEHSKVQALYGLAPYLPESLLEPTLDIALSLTDEEKYRYRHSAVDAIALFLTPDLLKKALKSLQEIRDQESTDIALAWMARYLPQSLSEEVLSVIKSISNKDKDGLNNTSLCIAELKFSESTVDVASLGDYSTVEALKWITQHTLQQSLTHSVLRKAVTAARQIDEAWYRADAITALAPYLTQSLLQEALAAAWEITKHIEYRGDALAAIVPYLPEPLFTETLTEVRRRLDEDQKLSWRLKEIALRLSELGHGQQAVDVAGTIQDEWYQVMTLVKVAPNLPETLAAARKASSDKLCAEALIELYHHISERNKEEVLKEAVQATKVMQYSEIRTTNLIELLPVLPREGQTTLLHEALTAAHEIAARGIGREYYQAKALAKLMPYLSPPQRQQVFDEIRMLMKQSLWKEVVESLPMPEREQLVQEEFESNVKQQGSIPLLKVLVTLIPFLPEKVNIEAVIASLQLWTNENINDYEADDLSSALLTIPNDTLSRIWKESQLLYHLSYKSRRELLLALRRLAPVIHTLGGTEAISEVFHAICDVRRWWP